VAGATMGNAFLIGCIAFGLSWIIKTSVEIFDILRWVGAGKTDRDIAAILGCSHRTVQKHLERVYATLGVETRTAAVMRALDVSFR